MKKLMSLGLAVGFAFVLGNTVPAAAEDITVLASNGVKAAVIELAPQFEKETGHRLVFTSIRL
jgi:ABC-type molybdate transport system substrate-binding protein